MEFERLVSTRNEDMVKSILMLLLAVMLGCSVDKTESTDSARSSGAPSSDNFDQLVPDLEGQARSMAQAVVEADAETVVALTHPTYVTIQGGAETMAQGLRQELAEMAAQGFKISSLEIGRVENIRSSAGALYAIVPTKTKIITPDQTQLAQESFLVACSDNFGKQWYFLDGTSFQGDRELVQQVFPKFPEQLVIPAPKAPQSVPVEAE